MGKESKMTERDLLNDLFAEAQAKPVAPSPEFMARVLADAAAHQPQPAPIARPWCLRSPALWGWWRV